MTLRHLHGAFPPYKGHSCFFKKPGFYDGYFISELIAGVIAIPGRFLAVGGYPMPYDFVGDSPVRPKAKLVNRLSAVSSGPLLAVRSANSWYSLNFNLRVLLLFRFSSPILTRPGFAPWRYQQFQKQFSSWAVVEVFVTFVDT